MGPSWNGHGAVRSRGTACECLGRGCILAVCRVSMRQIKGRAWMLGASRARQWMEALERVWRGGGRVKSQLEPPVCPALAEAERLASRSLLRDADWALAWQSITRVSTSTSPTTRRLGMHPPCLFTSTNSGRHTSVPNLSSAHRPYVCKVDPITARTRCSCPRACVSQDHETACSSKVEGGRVQARASQARYETRYTDPADAESLGSQAALTASMRLGRDSVRGVSACLHMEATENEWSVQSRAKACLPY